MRILKALSYPLLKKPRHSATPQADLTFPVSLGTWDVPANAVMQAVIEIAGIEDGQKILLEGIDATGKARVRRWLTSERGHYKTAFVSSADEETFKFRLTCTTGQKKVAKAAFEFRYLHEAPNSAQLLHFDDQTVTVSMATYPARRDTFPDAVNSLVDQADNLLIYLNNYREVPEFLRNHRSASKINYILDTASNLRAAAKFTWADRPGYHVIVDDDIIYPSDYVSVLRSKIELHRRTAVVGVHAANFFEEIPTSGNHRAEVFRFENALDQDRTVHLLGTGTIAFHSSTVTGWNWKLLRERHISNDEAFAITAKHLKIPLVALARPEKWLKSHPEMQFGIFEEKSLVPGANAAVLDFLRENQPWPPTAQSY